MHRNFTTLILATTCLAGIASPALAQQQGADPAAAQGAQDAPTDLDQGQSSEAADGGSSDNTVVVTGSRIRGENLVSTAPITALSSRELQLQSAFNVQDALNRLPQIASDNTNTYNGGEGRQRLNLRRIGFNRTLTLIDGQRLGESEANDANVIPVSLVDRIDILTGGASAVYGSDAIAGVINFILKKDFNGVLANLNYGFYNHNNGENITTDAARRAGYPVNTSMVNDGGTFNADLTIGKNFADGRGNIALFGAYNERSEVKSNDRSYAICRLTVNAAGATVCGQDLNSPTGYFRPLQGAAVGSVFTNAANGSRTFVPFDVNRNAYNVQGERFVQRAGQRYNAAAFLNFEFDPAAQFYANALFSKDQSSNQLDPSGVRAVGGTVYSINCDNPFLSPQQAQSLCGAQAGSATSINTDVRYRFTELRQRELENLNYRFNAGLRGDFGKSWHYDINGLYSGTEYREELFNETDPANLSRALQVVNRGGVPTCKSVIDGTDPSCVPLDIFRAGGPSPQAIEASYFRAGNGVQRRLYRQILVNANLSGNLGDYGIASPFAEKGIAFALGAEHRESRVLSRPDAQYTRNYGAQRSEVITAADDVYGEIQVPLIENVPFIRELTISGALRGSKYRNIPDFRSTYKIDALWRLSEDIMFRGSYNKATRAPNVSENIADFTSGDLGVNDRGDPCAGTNPLAPLATCQLTGVTQAQYGRIPQCPDFRCSTRVGGVGSVVPETGKTYTAGVVLTPQFLRGFTFSADYYNIKITQPIGFYFANDFITNCLATRIEFFCNQFVRNSDGSIFSAPGTQSGFVWQGRRNGNGTDLLEGIDFQAAQTLNVGTAGRFDAEFVGTLLLKKGGDLGVPNSDYNTVGLFGPFAGVGDREWQHTMRLTFSPTMSQGKSSLVSVNWRHIGGVKYSPLTGNPIFGTNPANIPNQYKFIPAYNYIDLAGSVTVDNLTLRLTVNNLFDVTPPVRPRPPLESLEVINTVASLYDPLGRFISVGASLKF